MNRAPFPTRANQIAVTTPDSRVNEIAGMRGFETPRAATSKLREPLGEAPPGNPRAQRLSASACLFLFGLFGRVRVSRLGLTRIVRRFAFRSGLLR